jgi:hypothetical protein
MLGNRYSHLIEKHSSELAAGLVKKLHTSERTQSYRQVPADELQRQVRDLYQNLGEWLNTKTEPEVQKRYSTLGRRRAELGVPVGELIWALILSKEHLWTFLEREAFADTAIQLVSELSFILSLEQFFDRAIYYAIAAYSESAAIQAA